MPNPLVAFFRTGPDRVPPIADRAVVDQTFRRYRTRVFWAVTLGYAWFYVARVNFSVVKKPLLDEGILTGTEMGLIGSAMLGVYAFGKLFNGFLADHANIRRFMSAALAASAIINLVLGFTTWFWAFLVLWALNGWFQSVGSAPSVVSLSQWFSPGELGTRYGLWSVSHSLGEGLSFLLTAALVSALGWRWGFWWPGLACLAVAWVLSRTLADRPGTLGLPPVAEWRNDHPSPRPDPGPEDPGHRSAQSIWASQREVLGHPAIWVLGLAGATMSATRYGVMNWGMLFLQESRGYSMNEAGSILSVYPVAALAGAGLSGVLSDRLFHSRRNVPALLMGLVVTASLVALAVLPARNPWLDSAIMVCFGFHMGGLLTYLGGLMAVDLSPKRAAGAAMGVIGIFCYLGAAVQDTVSGWLVDRGRTVVDDVPVYDFGPLLAFWIGCSVVSILMTLLVWNARPRE
ncbi:MAG TPA: MFS transporter [Myxococcota bacterium]|nr:MFS transporter [Myxococcota bacterium]HQK51678.1 MFS transporter [Myxococcota bacterium]